MKNSKPELFRNTLGHPAPPINLGPHEKALWYAGKGEWEKAHEIVQDMNDPLSSQIHAFLHRQERDIANAQYWYRKAGVTMPDSSLDKEWETLVQTV